VNVLVAGAGAVGTWLGAALVLGGARATLVARGPHGDAMAAAGVTMRRSGGAGIAHVRAPVVARVADAAPHGPFDATLVAVKSYATADLAAELAAGGTPPVVISVQNGLSNETALAVALPRSNVVAGTMTTGVALVRPGVVEGGGRGGVGLAVVSGAEPIASEVAERLEAGGVTVRRYADGQAMKWSKLLLNLLGSATPAILSWTPRQVFADRRLFEIERRAWLEAAAVMRTRGVPVVALPGYPVPRYARLVGALPAAVLFPLLGRSLAGGRGARLPSVAADLAAGRGRTEIGALNGAVVAAGTSAGVPTPVNAVLTRLVDDLAAGRVPREAFADRPEALLAAVEGARR